MVKKSQLAMLGNMIFSRKLSHLLAGESNRYGHPSQELLRRAANVGAAVLRTDELGTIEVITDGRAMWWEADGK